MAPITSGSPVTESKHDLFRAAATIAAVTQPVQLAPRIAALLEPRLGKVACAVLRRTQAGDLHALATVSSTGAGPDDEISVAPITAQTLRAIDSGVRLELPDSSSSLVLRIEPFRSDDVAGAIVVRAPSPTNGADELLEAIATGVAERLATPLLSPTEALPLASLDQLDEGLAVLDPQGHILLLNRAAAVLFETDRQAAVGKHISAFVRPGNDPTAHLVFREIERGARKVNADVQVVVAEKRELTLAVRARKLPEGQPGALMVFQDVTEIRQQERALRQARDFLERLVDSSSDAIVAADVKGRILVFNRAAEKLFEIPSSEVKNTHVAELYPRGGAQEIMRLLRESPDNKIEAVRTYGRTRSGEHFPIEVSANLLKESGKEQATVGLLRDLRERVRVEAELSRARARLLDAEKLGAVTALAGATAHELNQPLTVILGYVEILLRRVDPALAGPLQSIASEAERMAKIVKRIARLTRVETMPYVGDSQIVDLERSSEPPPHRKREDE